MVQIKIIQQKRTHDVKIVEKSKIIVEEETNSSVRDDEKVQRESLHNIPAYEIIRNLAAILFYAKRKRIFRIWKHTQSPVPYSRQEGHRTTAIIM